MKQSDKKQMFVDGEVSANYKELYESLKIEIRKVVETLKKENYDDPVDVVMDIAYDVASEG